MLKDALKCYSITERSEYPALEGPNNYLIPRGVTIRAGQKSVQEWDIKRSAYITKAKPANNPATMTATP